MNAVVVVPTYNEAENIIPFVERLLTQNTGDVKVSVLVVDDGSPDGTGQLVDALAAQNPRVLILHRQKKMGLGTAYREGFAFALAHPCHFDFILQMDADFSHDPAYLPMAIAALKQSDFVIGSRNIPGGGTKNWGLGRKILSKGGSFYARTVLGAPIQDFTGGFNGWNRKVLSMIDLNSLKSDGYSFQIELKYRGYLKNFSFKEFPIIFEDRREGQSKMNKRIVFEALKRVWEFRLRRGRWMGAFLLCALGLPSASAATPPTHSAILVDKKTNQLFVTEMVNGKFAVKKTFHTTLGKVVGDKEQESDLKTPEGIYLIKNKLTPPGLKPKFGVMAFYLDYPNAYDRIAGKTGFDIMLHATDEPKRLAQNFDSEGCVVVKNEDLSQIAPSIQVGLTPVLIFSELTPEYLDPSTDVGIKIFFSEWISAWESKSIEKYMNFYHTDFVENGKTKAGWQNYKTALNQKYARITVGPEKVYIYKHPKYTMITFTQNYKSFAKSGSVAFKSTGTKILFVAEEFGQPKIISEAFSQQRW